MTDISDVSQLILRERKGRDRGWWQQMRDCYDPVASVSLSWFQSTGTDFVSRSEVMSGLGDRAVHRLAPPVVHLHGERAVVLVSAAIEIRTEIEGVEADATSFTRLVNRARKSGGRWLIVSLDCIYERDTMQPAIPGSALRLETRSTDSPSSRDPTTLARFRKPYRILGFVLSSRGYPVADDLFGDDRPEAVAALYDKAFAWLRD